MSEVETFVIDHLKRRGGQNMSRAFNYVDSGLIDSLGVMRFVSEIEETFDIELRDEDILSDEFRTLGGVIEIVEQARVRAVATGQAI